jgi:hypothetical protein
LFSKKQITSDIAGASQRRQGAAEHQFFSFREAFSYVAPHLSRIISGHFLQWQQE